MSLIDRILLVLYRWRPPEQRVEFAAEDDRQRDARVAEVVCERIRERARPDH